MNALFNALPEVILEAVTDGALAEPAALLQTLAAINSPIEALSDHDQTNALFTALDTDFGFIRFARGSQNPLQPAHKSLWASLIRWLIHELTVWRPTEDPANRKLVAIFIVAQSSDWESGLWGLMPFDIGNNTDLIEHVKKLVSSLAVTFSARGQVEPLWERDAVENFKIADEKGDWVAISRGLAAFRHQIFPNTIVTQSVRFLYHYGLMHLVDAVTNLRQTVVAGQIATSLHLNQRLELAVRSDNSYVQFGCVYWTLTNHRSAQVFSSDEQQLLTALLIKVANDGPRWAQWMSVFNAHPIRYPALQISLGNALADAPEAAVRAYISSIVLRAKEAKPEPGRQVVAECLRTFHTAALPDRRSVLWAYAYERWLLWNFDCENKDSHLLSISWSDLDYAIVAFTTECMSETDRTAATYKILCDMQLLDDQWHSSKTDIVTSWNRLLSRFQPYAHAINMVKLSGDWLPENNTYLPFDPSNNQYIVQKYKLI